MTRHQTDPGAGYQHTDDHCDRCGAESGWAVDKVIEQRDEVHDLKNRIRALEDKRARSEGRDEYRDPQARTLAKVGVGAGIGAWIPQIIELIQKAIGG